MFLEIVVRFSRCLLMILFLFFFIKTNFLFNGFDWELQCAAVSALSTDILLGLATDSGCFTPDMACINNMTTAKL